MDYLVKWCEIDAETGDVRILNAKIAKLLAQPMVLEFGDEERVEIPKDMIVCDGCNEPNPEYVATDGAWLNSTVCESCRQRYYSDFEVRGEL